MLNTGDRDYNKVINGLFQRFPSFQKVGDRAYKPGIEAMLAFDALLGEPHTKYPTIHVAGTNGKGSVSTMLTSALAAAGLRVGLYTSPHIFDFRERMRFIDGGNVPQNGTSPSYISEDEVLDFVERWRETLDRLDLSFFEITTAMAFHWFATQNVDIAVIETGLGGRLDSTNIITPLLSIVTNIGYDHCEYLGHTLPEIAAEKAGIFKRGVPAIVGESSPETDQVFIAKSQNFNSLFFADHIEPPLWKQCDKVLASMDLQGHYQRNNLRTVLTAIDLLKDFVEIDEERLVEAIEHSAVRTDFHGRWEKLSEHPYVIADIGHNSHGLKHNFAQLSEMMDSGQFDRLHIIYGAMADKDVDEIMKLFPPAAVYYFVTVNNHRAMAAEDIMSRYLKAGNDPTKARCTTLNEALREIMTPDSNPLASHTDLVYIGGSAYLVSEALPLFK